ncbi:MAG TPA: hypothetical protein VI956_12045 [Nitrospirota bacterium]|nr:hypothetical protein [Nitrospirota bacterium]
MMIGGVLAFSMAVFIFSYRISKAKTFDAGKLAAYITLVAWGSMIVGLCISRFPL